MSVRMYKMSALICGTILIISAYACLNLYIKIAEFEFISNAVNAKPLQKFLEVEKVKQYGYWQVFETIYSKDDIKLISLENTDRADKELGVEIRIKGNKDKLAEMVTYLKSKENFSSVERLFIKREGEEEVINLKIKFLKER